MRRLDSHGVTLVELLVVISVSFAMMGVVTAFALDYWKNTTTLSGDQATLVSRLNASTYLNSLIGQSTGFVSQNDLPDNNSGVPDPAIVSGKYWIPIHAVPAATTMGAAGIITPLLYFRIPSTDASKNFIFNGAIPYEDNLILYMDGTTKELRSRKLINTGAPGIQGRTSCPPALASNACPADAVVSENVTAVSLRYFSRSDNLIDYSSITDPTTMQYIGPDYPSVEIVELTIKYFKKAQLGNAVNSASQTVIRVALRN